MPPFLSLNGKSWNVSRSLRERTMWVSLVVKSANRRLIIYPILRQKYWVPAIRLSPTRARFSTGYLPISNGRHKRVVSELRRTALKLRQASSFRTQTDGVEAGDLIGEQVLEIEGESDSGCRKCGSLWSPSHRKTTEKTPTRSWHWNSFFLFVIWGIVSQINNSFSHSFYIPIPVQIQDKLLKTAEESELWFLMNHHRHSSNLRF